MFINFILQRSWASHSLRLAYMPSEIRIHGGLEEREMI